MSDSKKWQKKKFCNKTDLVIEKLEQKKSTSFSCYEKIYTLK